MVSADFIHPSSERIGAHTFPARTDHTPPYYSPALWTPALWIPNMNVTTQGRVVWAALATLTTAELLSPSAGFVLTPTSMSSTATHQHTRYDVVGEPTPPFLTVSSSGRTLEAALGALDKQLVGHVDGRETMIGNGRRSAMGVLLYTPPRRSQAQELGIEEVNDGEIERGFCSAEDGIDSRWLTNKASAAGTDLEDIIQELHGRLPFVDHIIASPVLATASTAPQPTGGVNDDGTLRQAPIHDDGEDVSFSATLTLVNVDGLAAHPFVMRPPTSNRDRSSSLFPGGSMFLRGPDGDHEDGSVRKALNRAAAAAAAAAAGGTSSLGSKGGNNAMPPVPKKRDRRQAGHFDAICLAFAGSAGSDHVGEQDRAHDASTCISHIHRLNGMLRETWGGATCGDVASTCCPCSLNTNSAGCCPLVASVTTATDPVLVSSRDGETGDCRTVSAAVVGAVLTPAAAGEGGGAGADRCSRPSFHLVHAGEHSALHGSQFRIERMVGNAITHVVPVMPSSGTSDTPIAGWGSASGGGGGFSYGACGTMSAAEWCRQVISSTTLHEKLAMQRGLGVGVLERAEGTRAPRGVMRCHPARACFEVTEVLESGEGVVVSSSRGGATGGDAAEDKECCEHQHDVTKDGGKKEEAVQSPGDFSLGPREGDLCDFRAIGGTIAAMQAEKDAYTWLRASRLSSLLQPNGEASDGSRSGSLPSSTGRCSATTQSSRIQGCFVANAGARVVQGMEFEGCEESVRMASAKSGGSCPTVGLVSDLQLISVDNEALVNSSSCSAVSSNGESSGGGCGLAGVYVCG